MTVTVAFQAGDLVTGACRSGHTGVVLELTDPRAWADTLAFPRGSPSTEEVRTHLDDCTARGLSFATRVPVRWCFGMTEWERVAALNRTAAAKCRCLHGGAAP